jgi:two-component system, chemotaxis family, response regulator Rcp1
MEALRRSGIAANISSVTDGEAALEFLKQQGVHDGAPRPDLIFLDRDLPKLCGHQVLLTMKADPNLRQIPVVMLSGSENERDIVRPYDEQIAAYIIEPSSFDEYVSAILAVEELWFRRAALLSLRHGSYRP